MAYKPGREAQGLCVDCPAKSEPNRTRCKHHLAKAVEYVKACKIRNQLALKGAP